MVNLREKYGQISKNLLKIAYLERWLKFSFHVPLPAEAGIEVVVCYWCIQVRTGSGKNGVIS